MSEKHKPAKVPVSLFGVPVQVPGGELVSQSQGPNGNAGRRPDVGPASGEATSATGQPIESEDLVASMQQRAAEAERLLTLCQSLRRTHRCPGRCVFTGELRQGGMHAFWSDVDGAH